MTQPSKLFHAVVVTGAAMTSACQREPVHETTITPLPSPPPASTTPAPTHHTETVAVETTNEPDATTPPMSKGTTVLRRADAGCPPGSELPYPPCYYIR